MMSSAEAVMFEKNIIRNNQQPLPQLKYPFQFFNGPTPASFCSFQAQYYRNIVDFRRIRTRIVGIDGKHDDHLTIARLILVLYGNICHFINSQFINIFKNTYLIIFCYH